MWLPVLVAAGSLMITLAGAWQIHQVEAARRQALMDAWSDQLGDHARDRIEDYIVLLRGLAGLFAASEEVTAAEYHRYTYSLDLGEHYPDLMGLGTAFRLKSPEEMEPFDLEMARFSGDASEDVGAYFPTVYFSPDASPYARLRGYDMLTHPEAQAALLACWGAEAPVVSSALRIWPEHETTHLLLFSPLSPPEFPEAIAGDHRRWRGVVFAIVDNERFWSGALGARIEADFGVWVVEAGQAGEEVTLWTNTAQAAPPARKRSVARGEVGVAGREWTVVATRRAGLAQQGQDARLGLSALAVGLMFTAALSLVARSQTRAWLLAEARATQLRRAQRDLQFTNHQLERRVSQGTGEIARRVEQLRQLTNELAAAEQGERKKLAQVLHDDLQQLLVATRMQLRSLRPDMDPEQYHRALTQVDQTIEQAIDHSRSLSVELVPPVLERDGLAAALKWLADRQGRQYGLPVEVADHLNGASAAKTDTATQIFLFESTRELLFNAVKHAATPIVRIRFFTEGHALAVSVEDEGVGMRSTAEAQEADDQHTGMRRIRERAEMLGGRMEVHSAPGQGTRVTLVVPRHHADRP
ncbi:MAG: CHASE domain-containing protein [Phycisphaeraceae bacterium]